MNIRIEVATPKCGKSSLTAGVMFIAIDAAPPCVFGKGSIGKGCVLISWFWL